MTWKKWLWRRLVLLNFQAICIELNFQWKNIYDVVILRDVTNSSIISHNAHQSLVLCPSVSGIVFTLCQITVTPAREPYRIGILFKHKNGDFGAISVTEWSCAHQSLKWRVTFSDRHSYYIRWLFVYWEHSISYM